jgi:hypothetical protein
MANKPNREISKSFHQAMDLLAKKDIRLGQMFDNVFAMVRAKGKDPFYIENDELEKFFWKEMMNAGINPFVG